jgi:hypothetical protein
MTTDLDNFLSLHQLAKRWGVHIETVRRRRQEGLRAVQIGRRVLFRVRDVLSYERSQRDSPFQKEEAK